MTEQPSKEPQPEHSTIQSTAVQPLGRKLTIAGALAAGVGLVGFLIGISEPVEPARGAATTLRSHQPVKPAPTYDQLQQQSFGSNADWTTHLNSLKQQRPGLFDPVVHTSEMKLAAIADRMQTRAFDGAPPVVPHPVSQQSYANCLACHAEGMQLGERVATKISHAHFASCTQCHVESSASLPFSAEPLRIHNEFAGRMRTGPGSRAMPGAPPAIPHTTHLRTDCMSCHGLVARPGLRTTHPWLQNCVQCHAPSAELDQTPADSHVVDQQRIPILATDAVVSQDRTP